MTYQGTPTLRKRLLGSRLNAYRTAAGLTAEQVAVAIGVSKSKIIRQQTGFTAVSEKDLATLLSLYQVTDEKEIQRLRMYRETGRSRGTWHSFGPHVGPTLRDLADAETLTRRLRLWEPLVIPGILQTDAYTEATLQGASLWSKTSTEALAQTRADRKKILELDSSPEIWAVLGEAALRTTTGSPDTMRGQLAHLLKLARLPNINIQILPYAAGTHAGTSGSFMLLSFEESSDQAVYFELTNTLTDDMEFVAQNSDRMISLLAQAASPQQSLLLMEQILATL